MEEIILRSFNCPEYTFRVVDRVPNNYFVWNISQIEETGCYIPFAQKHPRNPYEIEGIILIDPDSLLAVKVTKKGGGLSAVCSRHWGQQQICCKQTGGI